MSKVVANLLVILLAMAVCPSNAGILEHSGHDLDFWLKHSLIIGRIKTIPKLDQTTNTYSAEVEVLSVEWTNESVPREITLNYFPFFPGALGTISRPSKETIFVGCITTFDSKWVVPTDYIDFMPERAGLLSINGADDPQLKPLIKKIAKVRIAALKGEDAPRD